MRSGIQNPRIMLLAWLSVAVVASFGVIRLNIETSTDSVLDRNGPSWSFYQESQRRFGGDEIVTYLIDGEIPFDPLALDKVIERSREFARLDGVWRVDSLATVPLIHSSPNGDLSMEPALANWDVVADHTGLFERIRGDSIAPRTLVSADERAFAVNVVLEQGAERSYESILKAMRSDSGLQALVSGVPVFRVAADKRTRTELLLFVPATVIVVGLLLFFLFGSIRAVVIPMGSSALGTWIMLGAMGGLGTPMTISTVVLPSVLLALGCAYSVHLLTATHQSAEVGDTRQLLEVSLPIALSGLTTALGFVAISLIRIEAIRNIGAFGALGVLLVCGATLTAGPAALTLWPLPIRPQRMRRILDQRVTPVIVGLASNHWRLVIGGWLIVMAMISIGVNVMSSPPFGYRGPGT